jgi:hypothetical protein
MSSIKRLERKQYIISILLVIFIDILLDLVLKDGFFKNFIGYLLLFYLIKVTIARSHDIGKSGWWILIPFYSLYLIFKDGDVGSNKYGRDPKNRKNLNE